MVRLLLSTRLHNEPLLRHRLPGHAISYFLATTFSIGSPTLDGRERVVDDPFAKVTEEAVPCDREGVTELVGDEDPPVRARGGVVRELAHGRLAQDLAPRQANLHEGIAALDGHEHRAAGTGESEVPGRRRQLDGPDHLSATAVDDRELVGLPEPYRDQPGLGIGHDPFRPTADVDHLPRRLFLQRLRLGGLGGRGGRFFPRRTLLRRPPPGPLQPARKTRAAARSDKRSRWVTLGHLSKKFAQGVWFIPLGRYPGEGAATTDARTPATTSSARPTAHAKQATSVGSDHVLAPVLRF